MVAYFCTTSTRATYIRPFTTSLEERNGNIKFLGGVGLGGKGRTKKCCFTVICLVRLTPVSGAVSASETRIRVGTCSIQHALGPFNQLGKKKDPPIPPLANIKDKISAGVVGAWCWVSSFPGTSGEGRMESSIWVPPFKIPNS
jgi:hypothetical protein